MQAYRSHKVLLCDDEIAIPKVGIVRSLRVQVLYMSPHDSHNQSKQIPYISVRPMVDSVHIRTPYGRFRTVPKLRFRGTHPSTSRGRRVFTLTIRPLKGKLPIKVVSCIWNKHDRSAGKE